MLEIVQAERKFPEFALEVTGIELKAGEIHGLVGHNGAGKSTLLKMVAGLIPYDKLNLRLDGRSLDDRLEMRTAISFVPDHPALYDWMTVRQFAKFNANLGLASSSMIEESLERFRVPLNKKIQVLSHGTRSKIGIAVAFARKCSCIFLDESLSGLDMQSREDVLVQIQEVVQQSGSPRCVLLSTHAIGDLEAIATNIVILRSGRCVLQSSRTSLQTKWLAQKNEDKTPGRRSSRPRAVYPANALPAELDLQDFTTATLQDIFFALG